MRIKFIIKTKKQEINNECIKKLIKRMNPICNNNKILYVTIIIVIIISCSYY